VTVFCQPQTQDAYRMWCEMTGLDHTSAAWGEVWSVLEQAHLLDADRTPQPGLFDPPELPAGDTAELRRLRLTLLAGAHLVSIHGVGGEHGTATAVVAALTEHELADQGLPFEQELTRAQLLLGDPRTIIAVRDSPSEALLWLLHEHGVPDWLQSIDGPDDRPLWRPEPKALLTLIMREAMCSDEFSVRVFAAAAARGGHRLLPLCHGQWVAYLIRDDR
jgi:hypothetical protein